MLSPIIREPVFEYAEHVEVHSISAGSKITISSGQQEIGGSNATSGSEIVKLIRPLQSGETLTAIAEEGGQKSVSSAVVEVQRLPNPLPPPICLSTLYAGSNCVDTWGMVPGSKVTVVSGNELLGEVIAILGGVLVRLTRPLTTADSVSLFATMGGQQSATTVGITPVMPIGSGIYTEKLPSPSVVRPLVACQRVAGVEGLIPGGRFWIYADGATLFDYCSPRSDVLAFLGAELKENQSVTAQQAFETLGLKSGPSDAIHVDPAKNLSTPGLLEPIYEGERSVVVSYLLNSVKMEIAVDGNPVGSADYAGDAQFDLGVELVAGQKIKVHQGLCRNWSSWSKEAVVQPIPGELQPPKVKEPLYACANMVGIADKVERALVKIYADGIFIGKGKMSVINIIPHLMAGQEVTAIQRVGNKESNPSQPPIVVKGIPDQVPAPKLEGPIDCGTAYITASNLLPGALVNVFLNQLLIGSIEAVDTSALVPIYIKLWPGAVIHGNQALCSTKSVDSNFPDVIGYIVVRVDHSGQYVVSKLANIRVETKYPVLVDTQVKLSSVKNPAFVGPLSQWEDPNVISVQGAGMVVIPTGKSTADFTILPVKQGFSHLKAEAKNYIQIEDWSTNYGWSVLGIERVNVSTGTQPQVDPDKIEIAEGDSFDLKFTLIPAPWADCEVNLDPTKDPWNPQSPLKGYLSVQPVKVIIPAGQKSGKVKVTALKKGPVSGDLWVRPDYYWGRACHITIKAAPPPPVTVNSYKLQLQWQAPYLGKMYVMGQVYPIPNGKLKKVRNINTIYPWRYHLWFPGPGSSTDDAFDLAKGYLLQTGDEATPAQLNLPESLANGLVIGATPSPLDTMQTGLVYVELIYET